MARPAVDDPDELPPYRMKSRRIGKGTLTRYGKRSIPIEFPPKLFAQISAEATSRGWSFNRTVIHLCEASIEGIE